MSKDNSVEIRQALKAVKSGTIDPVYLLLGNDCFLEQTFIGEVESGFFPEGEIQKTVMMPGEMKDVEIIDRLTDTDLFLSKQLFILRNPSSIKSTKIKNEIMDYIKNPQLEKCLIIIIEDWGDKSAFATKLKKSMAFINIGTPFESQMIVWINYLFKINGREQISKDVKQAVIEVAGDSLYHVANEIEKVCIGLDTTEEITEKDIYRFSGWKRGYQSWQFLTAVGERDLDQSIQIGQDLLIRESTFHVLLNSLANLFQEILYHKMGSGTKPMKWGYTGLSSSITKKLPQFAKGYKQYEIERNLRLLRQIDEEIKTTNVSHEYALTRFLFTGLSTHD